MEIVKISKGEIIINKGNRLKALYVLVKGSVQVKFKSDVWDMEPGSIIGMQGCTSDNYLCDYSASTDCMLYAYEYTQPEDYRSIFSMDEKYVAVFTMTAMRQAAFFLKRYQEYYMLAQRYHVFLMGMYQEYERLCEDYHISIKKFSRIDAAKPYVSNERIESCIVEFYGKMAGMPFEILDSFLNKDFSLGMGEIVNGADWMVKALNQIEEIKEYLHVQKELLLSAAGDDLFQRYFDLTKQAFTGGMDVGPLQDVITRLIEFARESGLYDEKTMEMEFGRYESHEFYEAGLLETSIWDEEEPEQEHDGNNYLDQILRYAEYDEEKANAFRQELHNYKTLPDMLATSDEVRQMRRKLAAGYYEIYKGAFKRSIDSFSMSPVIKMFLNFGFMDEELVGEDAADSLYDLTDELFLCKAPNVFTVYEWLRSIHDGINEPSRNEFDLDYPGYLHELRKTGKINEQQEKQLLSDNWKKVEYEIDNMFASTNRATYGRISVFCPILCDYDIINSVENMLVTAEKINVAIDYIRNIDFSIFYREVMFSDPEKGINREMVQKEILPNVILMPNAGNRPMMWQETAGIRKNTSARFILPILTVADVTEMMMEAAGRYRWEMCRKIQGIRWNDITEPSLTSEYSDYLQYYRKNQDLSVEAREKLKNALYKAKSNFREVFVKDYQNWIKYESKGSIRLNKVVRGIIFRYCPFTKAIRQELQINPMYQDLFVKYNIFKERDIRRIDVLYDRYKKKGGEITKELQENRDFYDL